MSVFEKKHIPNQLTLLRLALAAGFFVCLGTYDIRHQSDTGAPWQLYLAIALFVVAAATDALDGFLARRWRVVSKFGRVVDPFADKILILGGFIFLAGPNFSLDSGSLSTGVYPWMVAVILARELLVTTIRGAYEAEGVDFSANIWGKLKMVLQSIAIPAVIWVVAQNQFDAQPRHWTAWLRDAVVYATVGVTVLSGVPYITRAIAAQRR